MAAELQAQENRLSRARGPQTRGGGAAAAKKGKPKAKAKPAKKKSEKRVRGSDESDVEGDSDAGGEKKRKAGGGFSKPFNLSYPLAELCGTNQVQFFLFICSTTWCFLPAKATDTNTELQ